MMGIISSMWSMTTSIEEPLVPILKGNHVDIFLEVRRLAAKVLQNLLDLLFLRKDPRWQESSQLQSVSLFLGEGMYLY